MINVEDLIQELDKNHLNLIDTIIICSPRKLTDDIKKTRVVYLRFGTLKFHKTGLISDYTQKFLEDWYEYLNEKDIKKEFRY